VFTESSINMAGDQREEFCNHAHSDYRSVDDFIEALFGTGQHSFDAMYAAAGSTIRPPSPTETKAHWSVSDHRLAE